MRTPKPRYYTTEKGAERYMAECQRNACIMLPPEQRYAVLPVQHPRTGRFVYVVALMENDKLRTYCA